jgi:hypothetical protein
VVAGDPIDALGSRRQSADDVAAAHDDRCLDAELVNLANLVRDAGNDVRIDPERSFSHQGFARELEQNAGVNGSRRHSDDYK